MVSVIIPALNESAHIGSLIDQLNSQKDINIEVIVVDGGSTDDTATIVTASSAQLLHSEAGRGRQMNRGAAAATHDWLLFLHADSELTTDDQLSKALLFVQEQPGICAGHFAMDFETEDTAVKESLAFFETKTRLNRPGTFNGDQGLLIEAKHFQLIGGFDESLPFLEDQEFGNRFRDYGKFVTLPSALLTSARRFEDEGVQERIFLNAIIMGMFSLGHRDFFKNAPTIYRQAAQSERLDLLPFFQLVKESLFDQGWLGGCWRCCLIGQYASRNSWQLMLLRGLKTGDVEGSLAFFDRYLAPIANSPIGGLLGTLAVVSWFFFIELRLRFGRS